MAKALILMMLPLVSAGCANLPVSESVLCRATDDSRKAHAAALIEDGGPQSQATGITVLGQFQRGCGG